MWVAKDVMHMWCLGVIEVVVVMDMEMDVIEETFLLID